MRWSHDSAIARRDEHLARTRRLTWWVAGGATAASFCLATALGFALPGHTSNVSPRPAGQTGSQRGQAAGSGPDGGQGAHSGAGHPAAPHRRLSPPRQPPASGGGAPPVTSSGGS